MKKLLFTAFVCFISFTLTPQSCLPEGFEFTTQQQIDNFQTNYPGCAEIEGNVVVSGGGITNLDGLNILTSIDGYLWIHDNMNLVSLSGLEGVASIGGFLEISNNAGFANLAGLDGLTAIGGNFWISNLVSMTSLTGLEALNSVGGNMMIGFNPVLTSLAALGGVSSIGSHLEISDNDALVNLSGLEGITSIGGNLEVAYNDALTSLTGLEGITSTGGSLWIYSNLVLNNLTGLDGMENIGANIWIDDNVGMTSLEGIDNLNANSIGDLTVSNNTQLSTCEIQSICDYLAAPNGEIVIENNAQGCNSIEEVEEACEIVSISEISNTGNITIFPNPFSISTTMSYELKQPEKVTLSIYKHLGQLIYQTKENQPQGKQQLIWNAEGYADGIYYYRLQVGDAVANGKMVKR
jgi:hypothetical protein